MTAAELAKRLLRKPITVKRVEKLKGAARRFQVPYEAILNELAYEERRALIDVQKDAVDRA